MRAREIAHTRKDDNRIVRPFAWGTEFISDHVNGNDPRVLFRQHAQRAMADSEAFYALPQIHDYELHGDLLTWTSAIRTPSAENNVVRARLFKPRKERKNKPRAAVVVLPQWNAQPDSHVEACRIFNGLGMAALRLTLPYHQERRPPEIERAEYLVSSNIGRTIQSMRQAVLDTRAAVRWLKQQGYERIGILGTSLGSCLALLTTAHEPLIRAQALNHISPYFADVVWRGLSTEHVRKGLDGHIELDTLRDLWKPISPRWYLDRLRDRQTLLVYAKYDLTFPVDLSEDLVREFRERNVPHQATVLPCGHYSTGKTPFKYWDGWALTRFLKRAL